MSWTDTIVGAPSDDGGRREHGSRPSKGVFNESSLRKARPSRNWKTGCAGLKKPTARTSRIRS